MKIAEIVNFVADQEPKTARTSSFMQRIANAFTQGGRVKRPVGFERSQEPVTTTPPVVAAMPASGAETSVPSANAVSNTGTAFLPFSDWLSE